MSTFFVAAPTIDAAVSAFIAHEGPLGRKAATALGRALWAMNAEAMRWRYDLDRRGEDQRLEHAACLARVADYAWRPRELTRAAMAQALGCLTYQCGEGPVRETTLYKRLDELCRSYEETGIRPMGATTGACQGAPWGLRGAGCATNGTAFRSELMPEGEQLVIPGCERNRARTKGQLDLFG